MNDTERVLGNLQGSAKATRDGLMQAPDYDGIGADLKLLEYVQTLLVVVAEQQHEIDILREVVYRLEGK